MRPRVPAGARSVILFNEGAGVLAWQSSERRACQMHGTCADATHEVPSRGALRCTRPTCHLSPCSVPASSSATAALVACTLRAPMSAEPAADAASRTALTCTSQPASRRTVEKQQEGPGRAYVPPPRQAERQSCACSRPPSHPFVESSAHTKPGSASNTLQCCLPFLPCRHGRSGPWAAGAAGRARPGGRPRAPAQQRLPAPPPAPPAAHPRRWPAPALAAGLRAGAGGVS